MYFVKLIIFILIFSAHAGIAQVPGMNQIPGTGVECDANGTVRIIDNSFMDTADSFTSTCSSFSLKLQRNQIQAGSERFRAMLNRERSRDQRRFDFDGYARLDSNELCNCLKTNPLIDSRVNDFQRDTFRIDNVRRGSSNVFKTALRELQGNITKLKNLNLTGELHERSKSMCSLNSITSHITYTRSRRNQPGCNGAEMDIKLTQIFGNSDPAFIARKINSDTLEVNENSCITRQEFMRLRSSPSSALPGSQFYGDQGIDLKVFQPDDDIQGDAGSVELLSYDLFFNLGYRNPNFSRLMKSRVQGIPLTNPDGFHQLYDDPQIQKEAMDTIEEQCSAFKDNLKEYLCSDDQHKINSKAMSVIVRDELTARGNQQDLQFLVDYHTKKNACEPEPTETPVNRKYNTFIEQELLLSKASNDSMSDHINSEYIKFNDTFCGNKKGQVADLATLTHDFVMSKGIADALKHPDIIRETGLVIDVTKNPMISYAPGSEATDLPSLSPMSWDDQIWPKIRDKITEEQGAQLFAMFEMQTNLRAREMRSVRNRFIAQNPELSSLSPRDIDSIVRGDQTAIREIQMRYVANANVNLRSLESIPAIYREQEVYRAERFNLPPPNNNQVVVPTFTAIPPATETGTRNDPITSVTPTPTTATTEQIGILNEPATRRETTQSKSQTGPVAAVSGFTGASVTTSGTSVSVPGTVTQTALPEVTNISGSTDVSQRSENPNVKKLKDEIKQIQDEIAAKQRTIDENGRRMRNLGRGQRNPVTTTGDNQRVSDAQTSFRENYNFPRNLPVKTESGEYYMPDAEGAELSSAANTPGKKPSAKESGRSGGGASSAGASAIAGSGGGSGGGGSIGSGGGSASIGSDGSRAPASVEADEKLREELKLPLYEYPRFVPQSLIDMVGSIEKVVVMLGLEGKLFKTIEAIEEYDEKTGKIRIRYYQRYYDFVPENEFKNMSAGFADKDTREKIFKENFTFARTPENLSRSKKFAKATKEILKEEVEHNYVLGIQNQILSDEEVRKTIEKTMKLLN